MFIVTVILRAHLLCSPESVVSGDVLPSFFRRWPHAKVALSLGARWWESSLVLHKVKAHASFRG